MRREDRAACRRRPGSVWTGCGCPTCRTRNVKLDKYRKAGLLNLPSQELAARRVTAWLDAGFTDKWIASACGINPWQVHHIGTKHRRGEECRPTHDTTRRILAADIRTGTRGHAPALGLTRRLRALNALGYTQDHISAETGVSQGIISRFMHGHAERATARNWHAIVAFYDAASMTPGPSRFARDTARARGWAAPLAWDDAAIDDPSATPLGAVRPKASTPRPSADVAEDIAFIVRTTDLATSAQIAERLGYAGSDGVQAALERAGRSDLLKILARNAALAGQPHRRQAAS